MTRSTAVAACVLAMRPTAIACHVFAGGFTIGMKRYFDVRAHLEVSDYGGATVRHNHPEVELRVSPAGAWDVADLVGRVDVIYANPPCAPWSAAGARGGAARRDYTAGADPRDKRVELFLQAHRLLAQLRPRVLAIESVTRSWALGRPFVDPLIAEAAGLGYGCDVVFHDAYDCGAPQHRRRVFYVFTNLLIPWTVPVIAGPRTVGQALAGIDPGPRVQPLRPSEAVCLEHTPQGGGLSDAYNQLYGDTRLGEVRPGQRAGRPSFLDRRLALDEPAPTCVGGFHYYHPTEARHLTLRETAVLCGYPPDYEFVDRLDTCYRQVAQAVMPPVGAWLGATLADALNAGHARSDARTLAYDFIKGAGCTDLGLPARNFNFIQVPKETTMTKSADATLAPNTPVDVALRDIITARLWLNHRTGDAAAGTCLKALDAYEREVQAAARFLRGYGAPAAASPFYDVPPAAPPVVAAPPPVVAAPPPAVPITPLAAAAPPPAAPPRIAAPPLAVPITPPAAAASPPAAPPPVVASPPPAAPPVVGWPGAAAAPPPVAVPPPAPKAPPPVAVPPPAPKAPPALPQVSPELVEYFRPKLADGTTKPRAASELIKTMLRQPDPATGTCLYTDLVIAATALAVYPDLSQLVHKYPGETRYRLKRAGEVVPPARAG